MRDLKLYGLPFLIEERWRHVRPVSHGNDRQPIEELRKRILLVNERDRTGEEHLPVAMILRAAATWRGDKL